MSPPNNLPRISIPVVINEPQREAILQLADALSITSCPTTENDVIRIALRNLFVQHFPAVANPFLTE